MLRVNVGQCALARFANAARRAAGIESETALIEQIERPADSGGWGLADCRAAARRVVGPTATSVYGARVDYVWGSPAAMQRWRVAESHHVDAPMMGDDDDDPSTDHALVLCVFEQVDPC